MLPYSKKPISTEDSLSGSRWPWRIYSIAHPLVKSRCWNHTEQFLALVISGTDCSTQLHLSEITKQTCIAYFKCTLFRQICIRKIIQLTCFYKSYFSVSKILTKRKKKTNIFCFFENHWPWLPHSNPIFFLEYHWCTRPLALLKLLWNILQLVTAEGPSSPETSLFHISGLWNCTYLLSADEEWEESCIQIQYMHMNVHSVYICMYTSLCLWNYLKHYS